MRDLDLLIFDCDGVLVDSEVLASEAGALCLASCGIDITAEEVRRRYTGVSFASWTSDVQQRSGVSLPDGFAHLFAARLKEQFTSHLRPVNGIEALLDSLPQPRCVASSSSPERLAHALGVTGLLPRFAPHVYSAAQVAHGKPAPDLFLFAAERMAADPTRCLVIEDSVAGVQAARAARMQVVGFTGGSHCGPGHGEQLLAAGAQSVHAGFDSLAPLLRPGD